METQKTFKEWINGSEPVLVDFTAEWCGPCKAMAPILKEVAGKIKEKATILKVDVDRNRAVAEKFQIRGVPTFIIFQDGKVKWRQSGMLSGHALVSLLEQAAEGTL